MTGLARDLAVRLVVGEQAGEGSVAVLRQVAGLDALVRAHGV